MKVFAPQDGTEKVPRLTQDAPKTVLEGYLFDVQNCDRFWFVLGSILNASLEAFWVLLATSLGPIWGAKTDLSLKTLLGGLLGASWGRLGSLPGASWGRLGVSRGPLGGLLGALWSLLGASEGLFKRKPSKAKLSQATVG